VQRELFQLSHGPCIQQRAMTSVPDTRQIAVLPHSGDPETWFRDEEANASESSIGRRQGSERPT
jgi:hypothetical protein